MRKIIWLIVFCAPLLAQENPCTDSIFVKVKEVGFENLTEREFEYYKIKSNECEEYKNRRLIIEQTKEQRESQRDQSTISRASVKQQKELVSLVAAIFLFYLLFLAPDAIFGTPTPP